MDESIALIEFSKHGRRARVETVAYAHIEVGLKIWFPHRRLHATFRHDRNGDGVIDEAEMRMALRHYSIFCSAAHAGLEIRAYHPVCRSNLQPDFNVRVIERFGPDSSAALQELDESNRFVQKSAESTSNWPR